MSVIFHKIPTNLPSMESGAATSLRPNAELEINQYEDEKVEKLTIGLAGNTKEQIYALLQGDTLIINDVKRNDTYEMKLAEKAIQSIRGRAREDIHLTIEREKLKKKGDLLEIISIRGDVLNGAVIGHAKTRSKTRQKWIDTLTMDDRNYFKYATEEEEVYFETYKDRFVSMKEGLAQIENLIAELEVQNPEETLGKLLLLIGGPSAGGKTKLTKALFARHEDRAVELSTDHFYKGKKQMKKEKIFKGKKPDFDNPNALKSEEFVQCLVDLLHGRKTTSPRYDFNISSPVGTKDIEPKEYLFAEGIFDLLEEFSPDPSNIPHSTIIRVAVVVEMFELLIRRIRRDMERKGDSPIVILKYIKEFVEPAYKNWIIKTMNSAQIHIHNKNEPDYRGVV
ncbi:MAG: uridine kinase [Candidatus Gracilibacteria bacterium]